MPKTDARVFPVPAEWGTYDPDKPWRALAPIVDCGPQGKVLASIGEFATEAEAREAARLKMDGAGV